MMQILVNYMKIFEGYLAQLESLQAKIFLVFLLWVCGALVLCLIGAIGGIFSGWFIAFSIVANIVWIIMAMLIGAIISEDF